MKELQDRILADGKNMGGGILNVNSFLNHQVDCRLMVRIGQELASRFASDEVDKILTAEISGIAPALEVGVALGVPVVFARKIWSITMPPDSLERMVPSRTKGTMVQLIVARNFLRAIAAGVSAHSDHGRTVAEVFIATAKGEAGDYKFKDTAKLYKLAEELAVETKDRSVFISLTRKTRCKG